MSPRVMSLFSGYGGLDLGFQMVCPGAETVYVSDIEEGPCRVLAARFPDADNLGDITKIDWKALEPVDVILGGSPCQDLSQAGQRAGMKPGTRSGLWESMFHAIKIMRPRLVVWENVRGALNAGAFSLMESGTRHLGGGPDGPVLRALGRVLGDLAGIGYDTQWTTLRACDVGAPHPRARVFLAAYPAGHELWLQQREFGDATHTDSQGRRHTGHTVTGETPGGRASTIDRRRRGTSLALLPTLLASDGDKGGPNNKGGKGDLRLSAAAIQLLPTPTTQDGKNNGVPSQFERHTPPLNTVIKIPNFGAYAPAIKRWEQVTGRAAPSPTILSAQGNPQLSHHFVEWMMGLPDGWITDPALWDGYTPTRARNLCLRMAGNGVVPLQAATAINHLTHRVAQRDAA